VSELAAFDGLWLVPGSPYRDEQAVYAAVVAAREGGRPFLATCAGMQHAVVEMTRQLLGQRDASHEESFGESPTNVVAALACSLQGEEREIRPVPGTWLADLTGGRPFPGMHYCSYAPTAAAVADLACAGVTVEATADDAGAEVLKLQGHPFFVLTLFQPQVGASRRAPVHPIVGSFLRAAADHRRNREARVSPA
jgi:CTP synthase (UTP-ammonia lyase)